MAGEDVSSDDLALVVRLNAININMGYYKHVLHLVDVNKPSELKDLPPDECNDLQDNYTIHLMHVTTV